MASRAQLSEASGRSPLRELSYYLVVLLFSVPILAVFLYMITTSIQPPAVVTARGLSFDFVPTLDGFRAVLAGGDFVSYSVNSTIVAVGSTALGLLIGLPAAFAISQYRFRATALLILSARIIPGIAFLIPWFVVFGFLGWVDTYQALILTHLLHNLPVIVFLMVSFFDKLPHELLEASRVDGASTLGAFYRVALPLSRGGIAAATVLGFIFSWNHFLFSTVLAGGSTRTLPVAVFNFMSYGNIDWASIMAAATLITLPVIVMALFVQRQIITGLTAGATKG